MKNEGLLKVTEDYIFKNLFGLEDTKQNLIAMLNGLLQNDPIIKDLTLDNSELPKELNDLKTCRLDIKATTIDNQKLDIEMQAINTHEIPERALTYASRILPNEIKEGESYKGPKIISIWFLGENVTDRTHFVSDAQMMFKRNKYDDYGVMTDCIRVIFFELPKFNEQIADVDSSMAAWLSFIKNPEMMKNDYLKIPEINNSMNKLKFLSADKSVREIYNMRQQQKNDHNSELTAAKEAGLVEGEKKAKIESARKMLIDGLPIDMVAKYSGLSIDEVEGLES